MDAVFDAVAAHFALIYGSYCDIVSCKITIFEPKIDLYYYG